MSGNSRSALRLLREGNEDRILALLRSKGALSRSELAAATGLSRTSLWTIVSNLVAIGSVVEVASDPTENQSAARNENQPAVRRGKGRPPTFLTLNPASGLALGIDLGHQRIHVSIANAAHNVIASTSKECAQSAPWRSRIGQALDVVDDLVARHHISLTALEGVGVGVVGPVAESGMASGPRQGDRAELVHQLVADHLGADVHVDNNTRLGALAEAMWGGGKGTQNVLYLRLSYGVGGGLVLGGHLFSGAFGAAGEFGHVCVDEDGPSCGCGSRGCLERYVALPEILKQSGAADLDRLLARLRSDDAVATQVMADAGRRIGRVLAGAANVVNPEVIVIGGELAGAGEQLLGPIRAAFGSRTHRQVRRRLDIVPAELGEDGPALGGVALVLRRTGLLDGYPATQSDHPPTVRAEDPRIARA